MEGRQETVNTQQNSTLNENQPRQHNKTHERQASQQKFNKFLREQVHDARLMLAQYVKPYVKTNKNDYLDAEAIAEAVQRPTMRFVPIKNHCCRYNATRSLLQFSPREEIHRLSTHCKPHFQRDPARIAENKSTAGMGSKRVIVSVPGQRPLTRSKKEFNDSCFRIQSRTLKVWKHSCYWFSGSALLVHEVSFEVCRRDEAESELLIVR